MTAAVGVQVNKMKGRKVEGEDLGDHLEMRAKRERGHSRWSAPELGDETRDWVCRRGER
jgi:hypothetical protein